MAFLPHDHDQLVAECCDDVASKLPKSAGGLGDLITIELVKSLVRNGLDVAVAQFGDDFEEWAQTKKPQLREVVSANVLAYLEGLFRDMQDLKAVPARRSDPV